MICPKCHTENEPGARFCRSCGTPLVDNKPAGFKVFNAMYWLSAIVFAYCAISLIFPRKSAGFSGPRCSDLFGFNPEGSKYYYEEWMPVLIISGILAVLFYWLKNRKKK